VPLQCGVRIVDLSHRIVFPHWRWKPELRVTSSHAAGEVFQSSALTMSLHGFTHVDAPKHFLPGEAAVADVSLDRWVGEAAVIDLTHRGADDAISVDDLHERAGHLRAGDIALLRTDWDRKADITTREFWTRAPHTGRPAAEWLADQGVKAVGYDYPADPSLRMDPEHPGRVGREQQVTHDVFFPRGIAVVEYLANLGQLAEPRVLFLALPLKIDGGDGSPVRAVALEF
jgi:arylformamidase